MLTWYWFIPFFLLLIHFNFIIWSIYIHRGLVHRQLTFSPAAEHFFRFCVWLNFITWPNWLKFYVAQHRIHHTFSDSVNDVHSPNHLSFKEMFDFEHQDRTRPYYVTPEEVARYAPDIEEPNDWMQTHVYNPHRDKGTWIVYLLILFLFGPIMFVIGSVLVHLAAKYTGMFVVNYVVHKYGFTYQENKGQDQSKNLFPLAIFCCGEELHANHHWDTSCAKFSRRWYEFDLGWLYIRIFMFFGLIKLRKSIDTSK